MPILTANTTAMEHKKQTGDDALADEKLGGRIRQADPRADAEAGSVAAGLRRSLSARQVQMIAIGGTIGTGLFLGTGKSLATGGPASMLICYAIVGAIVFLTMLSLGEMAAFVPVAGSFCTFAGYVFCWWCMWELKAVFKQLTRNVSAASSTMPLVLHSLGTTGSMTLYRQLQISSRSNWFFSTGQIIFPGGR